MQPTIAVVYYSSTGTCHALARAIADGATAAGAQVRLRRVQELAPRSAIAANPAWAAHHDEVAVLVPEVTHDDLRWADGIAFGSPTRFGNIAAQLKQFIDTCGPLWAAGELADKAVTAFTSSQVTHGGRESTLLALYTTMHHWGMVIVSPGYTDESVYAAGGNPYGTSAAAGALTEECLAAAHHQGARLATFAARLTGRVRPPKTPTPAAASTDADRAAVG
jgi:NAD(P)H dehydrogenase (quinone)